MAGKASFCFGAQVGAEAQNVRGFSNEYQASTGSEPRAGVRPPRRIYFFDLVVDFLPPEDFLPALLRELDLLLLFFAMALVPPFLSDKFTDTSKSRQRNFCYC